MPGHPSLTIRQRSCLLRAARERLAQLHQDYDAVIFTGGDVGGKRDILFSEIGCITQAIQWLWLQPAVDDGG